MADYDLIIVGSGSGNHIPTPALEDWRVALVEKGVFGGTCLNRGCIPSKMLVYAGEVAETARGAARLGVHASVDDVDWPAIRDRVFGRIDPISAGGERYRSDECAHIDVYTGEGRFVAPLTVEVDGRRITGDHVLLAAGARPFIPEIPGLAEVAYETSDTIMRLEALPERLVVIGGGYIGAELGHVFGAFGSHVTIINRSGALLREEDADVSQRFTEVYGRRFDLVLGAEYRRVEQRSNDTVVVVGIDGAEREVVGDTLLVAAGRIPNSDTLGLDATGVDVDAAGRVVTDENLRTTHASVWAIGDLTNPYQLKHIANREADVAFHNIAHPNSLRAMDYRVVPHAVFGHPQVAGVGLTEQAAVAAGRPHVVATKEYGTTAYGWAMEDTDGFVKILADPSDRTILGAHFIGPQAASLIHPLVQAMHFGQTVDQLAHDVVYIHPALTEVIENCLIDLIPLLDAEPR